VISRFGPALRTEPLERVLSDGDQPDPTSFPDPTAFWNRYTETRLRCGKPLWISQFGLDEKAGWRQHLRQMPITLSGNRAGVAENRNQLHLIDMSGNPKAVESPRQITRSGHLLLWLSGTWTVPPLLMFIWIMKSIPLASVIAIIIAVMFAPIPAFLAMRREGRRLQERADLAQESAAQLKLQLDTVRYRTSRLREELQAADRQARLSHQLTLLGQFTAGFMHEFNNPLAIVAGRLEVLLYERKEDAALCADIERMLKETRYMSNIATTLLQALRRERGGQVFDAAVPQKALQDAVRASEIQAKAQGVKLVEEIGEAPKVDVPEHVIGEVVRGLLSNASEALKGREEGMIWVRLDPYRTAGAKVVIRVEDNGTGVPESIRAHLFEPFISHGTGRERLGLGLFLAASLLDMYDGRIRYEPRSGGGACFVVELPPTRFTRGQPYHWFAGGTTE